MFNPDRVARRLVSNAQARNTILFCGAMGTGKSTCVRQLAQALALQGVSVDCLSADPGTPQFGIPGAVCLARWREDDFHLTAVQPLCSLNAVRFRLPLVQAAARLQALSQADVLLVDAPGAVRGSGAEELLDALVQLLQPHQLIYLYRPGRIEPAEALLARLTCPIERLSAHVDARRPALRAREAARTALWRNYLCDAAIGDLNLQNMAVHGTPPRSAEPQAWRGLQLALLHQGDLLGMGQVVDRKGDSLRVRAHGDLSRADALLIRDAIVDSDGMLRSAAAPEYGATNGNVEMRAGAAGNTVSVGEGMLSARLINGVFGDPLLELHLRGQSGRILFDLGDAGLMSRRMLHKVSDVFITHAHFDHVCGFLDMLRARMTGAYPPLRVYGPPGITTRILAAVDSIDWDRIGDDGPELHLAEINTNSVRWSFSKVGKGMQGHAESALEDSVLLRQPEYCVRCATLDHGIPVLAFSLELSPRYSICKQRLQASGRPPGPWLNELKHALKRGNLQAMIEVPEGTTVSVAQLCRELVDSVPGEKLCYATDFADTEDNRETLLQLARHADLFFCEASFTEEDLAQAQATSHLTTRACGEIAAAAGVKRLVPFHFSKRYNSEPQRVYEQISNSCGSVRIARFAY